MADKQNPGALAGATGAGMPCHAIAARNPLIPYWKPLGQIVAVLVSRSARLWWKADD